MTGSDSRPEGSGISVSFRPVPSTSYASAEALAEAFGRPVLEPATWPADVAEISYYVDGDDGTRSRYRIASHRDDHSPILLTGSPEVDWAGRSPSDWLNGEWSEPPDLAHVRGLIGRVGIPPRLHAVIYVDDLAIQLIGYRTEVEIIDAVASLRHVAPRPAP